MAPPLAKIMVWKVMSAGTKNVATAELDQSSLVDCAPGAEEPIRKEYWAIGEVEPSLLEYYMSEYVPFCRHCRSRPAHRPRGLCWECYYVPSIRQAHARLDGRTSSIALKVNDYGGEVSRVLPVPVSSVPGTEAKIRALEERAANRQQLFHEDDLHFAEVDDEWRRVG